MTKAFSRSSYICVFILSKKQQHNWFYKNFYNLVMVGRMKLLSFSFNSIFNVISIAVQYTLSFHWASFSWKLLLFIIFDKISGTPERSLISPSNEINYWLIAIILISSRWLLLLMVVVVIYQMKRRLTIACLLLY